MRIEPIKTHHMTCGESLTHLVDTALPLIPERTILCITSKIVSLSQGHVVPREKTNKAQLVAQEADFLLDTPLHPYGIQLTITNHLLIPEAGIDASNGADHYVLYPSQVQTVAALIWAHVRKRDALKDLGVIITDSCSRPLRWGVTGVGLGWCGFNPLYSYVGQSDLDGRPLQFTHINVLDSLAAAAVFVMGEGNEQTPLALIHHAPKITFMDRPPTPEEENQLFVSMENDMYAPLLLSGKWRPGTAQ